MLRASLGLLGAFTAIFGTGGSILAAMDAAATGAPAAHGIALIVLAMLASTGGLISIGLSRLIDDRPRS